VLTQYNEKSAHNVSSLGSSHKVSMKNEQTILKASIIDAEEFTNYF
jgi:hypothetical protein